MRTEASVLPSIGEVKNICVFVADALRWDYLPKSIRERGLTCKTVAASLTTHTSLPSMVTGLWPERHGVFSWRGQVPEVSSLLEHPGFDCGYFMPGDEGTINDGTFSVLRQDERRQLESLNSPFSYFERHHGGHAPFKAAGWQDSYEEFIDQFSGDSAKHRHWYQKAVEGTVTDFENRLSILREMDELENTLIVFTSDHGEYLGEHGLVDHSSPLRPEAAYVPTVFFHPELPNGESAEGIMRHVDLYPTLLSATGEEIPDHVNGVDLFEKSPEQGYTVSTMNQYIRKKVVSFHDAIGVWDEAGGRVLNRTNLTKRPLSVLGLIAAPGWQATHLRRTPGNFLDAVFHYLQSRRTYDNPGFGWEVVEKWKKEHQEMNPIQEIESSEISGETESRLEDLGYL
ncbi:sulfatase-like hydrolase/transferase [Haloarcula sp. JP-L23]|uniref:sulfatase-like hydrolase/transferase n=1 Tax=Haloarcula sp. JP-L23 TaxID=2716717 RepID=UPI00140F2265|nr:sulfatase-like hydrolase/transferase [Haloarcula sp. JP-L23]